MNTVMIAFQFQRLLEMESSDILKNGYGYQCLPRTRIELMTLGL